MPLDLKKPILYLITGGRTTEASTPASKEFQSIVELVSAAVAAGIELIQIREKEISARYLFELVARSVAIRQGSATRLLVNDRADIAAAAGADGVHLTTNSLEPKIVRRFFGPRFLIGVSTHSLVEAQSACDGGADFAVVGPVFGTESKAQYGPPLGIDKLRDIAGTMAPFPILALGGISPEASGACLRAGAQGVAGISMFRDVTALKETVATIQRHVERQIN